MPSALRVLVSVIAAMCLAAPAGAGTRLHDVVFAPGANNALAVGDMLWPTHHFDPVIARFALGPFGWGLVDAKRLPQRAGDQDLRAATPASNGRVYAFGVDTAADAAIVASINPNSGNLTTECGPTGVATLGGSFSPNFALERGEQILVVGAAGANGFAGLFNRACQLVDSQMYDLGDTTLFLSASPLPGGGFALLGARRVEVSGQMTQAAVAQKIGAGLEPDGAARIIDYPGSSEAYLAGSVAGTDLLIAGRIEGAGVLKCLVIATFADGACHASGIAFDSASIYTDVTAGAAFPDGRVLAAGSADQAVDYDFLGLFVGKSNGALDPAFSSDGRQIYSQPTSMIVEVGDAEVGATSIAVVGQIDSLPDTTGYAAFFDLDGANQKVEPVSVSPDSPEVQVESPPPPPPPPPSLEKIKANVAAAWNVARAWTTVRRLRATRMTAGAAVQVRCRGRGCPFRQKKVRVVRGAANMTALFEARRLRPGVVLEVRVTKAGAIGVVVRFTVRKGNVPRRQALCLPPGAAAPTSC